MVLVDEADKAKHRDGAFDICRSNGNWWRANSSVCVCCKSFKRAQQIILLLPLIYKQQRMTVLETLSSMFTCSVLILDRDSCDGNFMESLLAWVRTKWKLVAARARKTKWTFIKINHHRCDGGTHATQSNTEMSAETVRQLEIIATRIHTHQFAVCAKWN